MVKKVNPFIRKMKAGSGWAKKQAGQNDNISAVERAKAIATRKERTGLFKDWYTPFLPRSHRQADAATRANLIKSNVFGVQDSYQMAHEGDRGKKALFIKGVNRAAAGDTRAKKQLLEAQGSAANFAKEMRDVMTTGRDRSKIYKHHKITARAEPNDMDALMAEQGRVEADGKKYRAQAAKVRKPRGQNGMGLLWKAAENQGLQGAAKADWVRQKVKSGALSKANKAAFAGQGGGGRGGRGGRRGGRGG